ncbi:MAG: AMP-binding protein [Cellvibrionales bacterium]|nr:AMP-binding protein [Cellvibrionales bacterium]
MEGGTLEGDNVSSRHRFSTFSDALMHYAKVQPNKLALRYFADGEVLERAISYQELNDRCCAIAHTLSAYKGERAILIYQPGVEFLLSFFACLYAGVIAVPAYPPKRNHHTERLVSILDDCAPGVILTTEQQLSQSRTLCEDYFSKAQNALPWVATDSIELRAASAFMPKDVACELAFLQYTSGSTGNPKGVMVSHANLVANFAMAQAAYEIPKDTHSVSWLPLFHDMGLIGAVMMPLFWGAGALLMPPNSFLQKPLRLLTLIDAFAKQFPVGVTQPNFAYQMLVDQVADEAIAGFDFSRWVFAMSGAEFIQADTLAAFTQKFCAAGFDTKAIRPAYGMAECTLFSTCNPYGSYQVTTFDKAQLALGKLVSSEENTQTFVSVGVSLDSQTLIIVDPVTLAIKPEGEIGEIWLQGDHIAKGYWNKPEENMEAFAAKTACGQGPFLRTGDLAAQVAGELYMVGRMKDMLIIRGKNHYPQDIELTAANACPSLVRDSIAAFTVQSAEGEALVIVAEVQRLARKTFDAEAVGRTLLQAVSDAHGIRLHSARFIRFASMPKTSSGKIQHFLVKQQYLNEALNVQGEWETIQADKLTPFAPKIVFLDMTADQLLAALVDYFEVNYGVTLTAQSRLESLGLDSVQWLGLFAELESWSKKTLDATKVWQFETLEQWVDYLIKLKSTASHPLDEEIEGFL